MALHELPSRRFYGILDTGYVRREHLLMKCRALIDGGTPVIQLRAKNAATEDRVAMLGALLPLCREHGVSLIINDDLEAALALDGVGLHVGQDDMAVEKARVRLGPGRILGLSNHSELEVMRAIAYAGAGMLDYFAVGPVFATQTKPDYVPVGLELVRFTVRQQPTVPWLAIGGINHTNTAAVAAAGAPAVVAVSGVLAADDTAAAVRALRQAMVAVSA